MIVLEITLFTRQIANFSSILYQARCANRVLSRSGLHNDVPDTFFGEYLQAPFLFRATQRYTQNASR